MLSLRTICQLCGLREMLPLGNPWAKAVAFKGHRFVRVNVAQRQTDSYCGCKQMAVRYGDRQDRQEFIAIEDDYSEHELSACKLLAN
jgi:hypothetical protein